MKLEDEIHQKKFKHEYQKLVINIKHTANWINQQNSTRLRSFGISPEQYNILGILRGQGGNPATVKLIKEHMLFRESDVSRLVDKLRRTGYVSLTANRDDRRAVDIVITDKGLGLMKQIDVTEPVWVAKLKTLTENEARELNRLLDRLRGPKGAGGG
jgi:DNA-binding MarR family transcriptional regulator